MDLNNKVAVVIGASGGIGQEIVKSLKKEGVNVLEVSRESEKYPCDLENIDQVKSLVEKISSEYQHIDLLFNSAGIGIYKTIEEATVEDWNKSIAINLTGPFVTIKYFLPLLQNSNSVVINLGSGMGTIPMGDRIPYCASKFGLRGMSLSLSKEFPDGKPKICHITLGSTLTEFGPLTLEEKRQESLEGKAYFTPDWVANKLVEIIKEDKVEDEIVLFPSEYQNS